MTLEVTSILSSDFFHTLADDQNVMFLRGGLITEYGINVAGHGDIVAASILKQLTAVFQNIKKNTVLMLMRKND